MASYYGSYLHTLDTKGRVSIPSEMRKASGDVFVLTRGFEECLNLYPADEWELVERELKALRTTSRDARYYVRQMMSTVRRVVVDGHGRMLDYSAPSGQVWQFDLVMRRCVENTLLCTQFTPATTFGVPKSGRLRITLRGNQVEVKG